MLVPIVLIIETLLMTQILVSVINDAPALILLPPVRQLCPSHTPRMLLSHRTLPLAA